MNASRLLMDPVKQVQTWWYIWLRLWLDCKKSDLVEDVPQGWQWFLLDARTLNIIEHLETSGLSLAAAPAHCDMNPLLSRLLAAKLRSPNSLWQRINLVARVPCLWWRRLGLMFSKSKCSAVRSTWHSFLLLLPTLAVQPRVTRSWLEILDDCTCEGRMIIRCATVKNFHHE